MLATRFYTLGIITLTATVGCSGPVQFGPGKGLFGSPKSSSAEVASDDSISETDSGAPKDPNKPSSIDGGDTAIDEPIMVGGTFLVCAQDTSSRSGCRLDFNAKKAALPADATVTVTLLNALGQLLGIAVRNEPETSPWHWTFDTASATGLVATVRIVLRQGQKEERFQGGVPGAEYAEVEEDGQSVAFTVSTLDPNLGPIDGRQTSGFNMLIAPYYRIAEGTPAQGTVLYVGFDLTREEFCEYRAEGSYFFFHHCETLGEPFGVGALRFITQFGADLRAPGTTVRIEAREVRERGLLNL